MSKSQHLLLSSVTENPFPLERLGRIGQNHENQFPFKNKGVFNFRFGRRLSQVEKQRELQRVYVCPYPVSSHHWTIDNWTLR
jgi:hypothetical protein